MLTRIRSSWSWPLVAGAALLMVVAGCGGKSATIPTGTLAPTLDAAGWLQGSEPTPDELSGRVVVVDAWGWWCQPCRAAAPELVAVHRDYAPRGVVFIGLTPDGSESLPEMEAFVKDYGITWPNGFGAQATLSALGVHYFPTVIVIGADGRVAWSSDDGGTLPVALDRALRAAGEE